MSVIDLRSDTVTRPGPEMRRVMAEAEVGDDVFRDDPTVDRMEDLAAGMLRRRETLSYSVYNTIELKLPEFHSHQAPPQSGRGTRAWKGALVKLLVY